jgi:SMODS and SLOG-associating 2TM effector domain family 4
MFRLSVVDHVRLNFDQTSQNYTVHARAAERLAALTTIVRMGVLVLMGVATAAAMTSLIVPQRPFLIVAAVAAGLAFAAHASYLASGVEGRVNAHRSCAHRLWLVCDRYRSLLGEMEDGLLDSASILRRRDELSAQVHAAYDQGFTLDQNAYEGARQTPDHAAGDAEGSDEQRDVLPASLHSGDRTRTQGGPH